VHRAHSVPRRIKQFASKRTWVAGFAAVCVAVSIVSKNRLDLVPDILIDDRFVLARVDLVAMSYASNIDWVRQHVVKFAF
jgi:hypothetical protein